LVLRRLSHGSIQFIILLVRGNFYRFFLFCQAVPPVPCVRCDASPPVFFFFGWVAPLVTNLRFFGCTFCLFLRLSHRLDVFPFAFLPTREGPPLFLKCSDFRRFFEIEVVRGRRPIPLLVYIPPHVNTRSVVSPRSFGLSAVALFAWPSRRSSCFSRRNSRPPYFR